MQGYADNCVLHQGSCKSHLLTDHPSPTLGLEWGQPGNKVTEAEKIASLQISSVHLGIMTDKIPRTCK